MSVERYTNAYSRTTGSNLNFADAEVPSGIKNGSNLTFTLAYTPASGTVRIYLNGNILTPGTDFTVSGKTVTMDAASAPLSTDSFLAFYRF